MQCYPFHAHNFRIPWSHSSKLPDCSILLFLISRSILKMIIDYGCLLLGPIHYRATPHTTIYKCYNCQQLRNLTKNCPNNARCVNCGLENTDIDCSKTQSCINYITSNQLHETVFHITHKSSYSKCPFFRQTNFKESSCLNTQFQLSIHKNLNQHPGSDFRRRLWYHPHWPCLVYV